MNDGSGKLHAGVQVGRHASRGFAWTVGTTLLAKVTAFGGQVLLAWFLEREHFGMLGLALTVTSFTGLLTNLGIRDVLVRRQKAFTDWAASAVKLSALVGVASGVATLLVSPIAARAYGEPSLISILAVLAAALPFTTIAVVPEAYLDTQLRFRTTAIIGFAGSFGLLAFSILFAWAGLGAMSLALPRLVIAVGKAVVLWALARPPLRAATPRPISGLISDGFRILGIQTLLQLLLQADYIALGVWRTTDEVGLYYFAFNLSVQVIQLLTVNVAGVLFPVFSKIGDDPARQIDAFIKATRVLALAGMPLLMLQAAIADPLVRLLFESRWHAAGPLLAMLSLSMAIRVASGAGASLLKAQGRFNELLVVYAVLTASFIAVICPAAALGGPFAVAATVALWSTIPGLCIPALAVRAQGNRAIRAIVIALLVPLSIAGGCTGIGYFVASLVSGSSPSALAARIGLTSCLSVLLYAALMHRFAPAWWNEAVVRVRQLRG